MFITFSHFTIHFVNHNYADELLQVSSKNTLKLNNRIIVFRNAQPLCSLF